MSYEIDLDTCTTSPEVLDWIMQVDGKVWATPTVLAGLVRALNDDGLTLIVIEHDIDFVDRIADRVTVLDQGSIFREGSIGEIRADEDVREIYLGGA